jgi:D-beta-D-heptose 7-phosphate kinase/D-beta-D-heptose 1-phosphate adenosyltransferase
MSDSLLKYLGDWKNPKILVVGDVMLDRYVWGSVERISPEAPIPVMREESGEEKLGGAGAVVMNLAVFGARVEFVSVVGGDAGGRQVVKMVRKAVGSDGGILVDRSRSTTIKTRFLGSVQSARRGIQHILRLDSEVAEPVSSAVERRVISEINKRARGASCVLLPDYFKGLLTEKIVSACIKAGKREGAPVIIDPRRSSDYGLYRGATGLTPNRFEANLATGVGASTVEGCAEAGRKLVSNLGLQWCSITMDKDGQYLVRKGAPGLHLPTKPRLVYDVSGAGDMVLAAIGMALACGNPLKEAVRLSNIAAGVEVGKIGVATVALDEMRSAILSNHPMYSDKIKTRAQIGKALDEHRKRAETIVMTNGCFDILHAGHIQFLNFARNVGDVLVVCLNTDRSVRALKGEGRPVNPQDARARVLAALADVDYVVLFDEETPASIVRGIRPDKLVKGEDWRDKGVVGREFVESYGGEVVLAPLVNGLSTSGVIRKIKLGKGIADGQD